MPLLSAPKPWSQRPADLLPARLEPGVPTIATLQTLPLFRHLRRRLSFQHSAVEPVPSRCERLRPVPYVSRIPVCAGWLDKPVRHKSPHRPAAKPIRRRCRTAAAGTVGAQEWMPLTAPSCEPGKGPGHRWRLAPPAAKVPQHSKAQYWFGRQVTSVATTEATVGPQLEQTGNKIAPVTQTHHHWRVPNAAHGPLRPQSARHRPHPSWMDKG